MAAIDVSAITGALERLDAGASPDAVARLGVPWDAEVEAVVRAIATATPEDRAAVRAALSPPAARVLLAWGERMASLAVRRRDRDLVVLGLTAVAMAGDELVDFRERLIPVPLHRRAAQLIGEKPKRLFDAAAALSDEAGARWLRDRGRSRAGPRRMGFREGTDADGGFRFRQDPPHGMTQEQLEAELRALARGEE